MKQLFKISFLLLSIITSDLSAQKNKLQEKIIGSWQQVQVIYNPNSKNKALKLAVVLY